MRCLKKKPFEQTFFMTKYHPFRESIVLILGLIESRDLVSQDSEDSLGGIAGLKAGKERMRG
jgi:hypothetical protein